MSETTISADDLAMFKTAQQQAQIAEQQLQRAQQVFGQAQQQHIAAIGALQFTLRTIQSRPGFPEGGGFHPETGAIVVNGQVTQPAAAQLDTQGVPLSGVVSPALESKWRDQVRAARRKKGA